MSGNNPLFHGIVVALKANYLEVEIDDNLLKIYAPSGFTASNLSSPRFLCTRRSRLDHEGCYASVGDLVVVENIDWSESRAVVSDVTPRKSWLSRPPVANVTEIVVVLSVNTPSFALDQASRFLLIAEQTGLNVLLVLSKIDLIDEADLARQLKRLQEWGYKAFPISVKNGKGIEDLLEQLRSTELAVLCGPSGVGKSSLLQYILPEMSFRTAPLSQKLKRGRHTTRHVELFAIGKGSLVADTPGFNRPDFYEDPKNLALLFPELRDQLIDFPCKFRNCFHKDELGCGIHKDWERYPYYRELLEEMISLRRQYQADSGSTLQ